MDEKIKQILEFSEELTEEKKIVTWVNDLARKVENVAKEATDYYDTLGQSLITSEQKFEKRKAHLEIINQLLDDLCATALAARSDMSKKEEKLNGIN